MEHVKTFLKNHVYIGILLTISFCLLIPSILNHGIHGDDSTFHIINIMSMDKNSSMTQMPSRIRPYTANNFGYGSGIFYPELVHITILYIYKITKWIHLTLHDSIFIFLFSFIFLTGMMMRKLLYKITKNNTTSILGAILYITYPYFLADIYRRSAYGELISFLDLPLVFLGLYNLFYENKKVSFYLYFVLGYYLLFSSHLISTVYVTIFTGIFLLCQGKALWKKEKFTSLVIASIFSIFISLNNLIPILEHKLLGNYMVFEPGYMYSKKAIKNGTLPMIDLITPSNWLTTYIPLFILLLIGYMLIKRKKLKEKVPAKIVNGVLIIFGISLILISYPLIWNIFPSFLLTIQFPFRICTYLCFSGVILASFGYFIIKNQYKKIILGIILFLTLLNTLFIFQNKNYTIRENITIKENLRDGGMGWSKEYLPKNTYQNLSYFENRDSKVKLVNGNAKIKILEEKSPNLKFKIQSLEKCTVEIPRLYYLWYKITLKTEENQKLELDFYENSNGFIEFEIPKSGTIDVQYQKTKVSQTAYLLSLLSMIVFVCFLNIVKKNENKKTRG